MDAPSGSGEFVEADELERLRRRAYGPDADIGGDAAALVRLAALEAARRRQTAAVEPAGAAVTTQDTGGRLVGSRTQAAPWWSHRRWVAILGAAIAALALIAGYVAGISRLLAPGPTALPTESSTAQMPPVPDRFPQGLHSSAPHEILALRSVGADADRPIDRHGILELLGIDPDELRRYEDFDGLNVWSGESRSGMVCLFVAVPVQGIREGYSAEGCSPEGFDTLVELPQQGSGSVMRFLLRDDRVDVLVYERVADPSGSQG